MPVPSRFPSGFAAKACRSLRPIHVLGAALLLQGPAMAAGAQNPTSLGTPFSELSISANASSWLPPAWHGALDAALPSHIGSSPALPATVPANRSAADPSGTVDVYNASGSSVTTATNAFFLPLGTNGRSCSTCHLPANGMGLSVSSVAAQLASFGFGDPLFAPVDAATCPKNVPAALKTTSPDGNAAGPGPSGSAGRAAFSLLLDKALFRVALPVPKSADYTISVVGDPYGCNTDANYDQSTDQNGVVSTMVSVYRRPLLTANLKFKTITAADTGKFPGTGLTTDPFAGEPESGIIMWDGREPTLQSQATDATLLHAQALRAPSFAQIAQIVAFETSQFSAQIVDHAAGSLTAGGNAGGPATIAATVPGEDPPGVGPAFGLYPLPAGKTTNAALASIARGEVVFNARTFQVTDVAGLNDVPGIGNPVTFTCSGCHRQTNAGTADVPNAALDTGVGGSSTAFGGPPPSNDLPLFKIVCKAGSATSFHNAAVVANDPGKALFTGKCADAAKFTVPGLRALASRAPYFHDGSAATLKDVVNFYNHRFRIALSPQDTQDLVNFLGAL